MMGRKKIEIIQAMRGIAALEIVYFHTEYGPWKSANWGVDFFFILSGYFLMMSTKAVVGGGSTGKVNVLMFFYLLFFTALKTNHKQRGNIVTGMTCQLIVFRPENVMLKFWTQPGLFDFVIGIGASILLLFSGYYLLGDCFGYLWNMLWGGVLLFLCLPLYDMPVNRFMKLLGDMSYSIYMAHFLIIGFICRVLIDNTKLSLANTVFVMAAVVFVIPCSWVVYIRFLRRGVL